MEKVYSFDALIKKTEGVDSGYIDFPFDVEKEFGTRGQVKVIATFDGYKYRGSLCKMKSINHWIGLNKEVRTAIGKGVGDTVNVTIIKDVEERTVEIPQYLSDEFNKEPLAFEFYNKLSFSHKREYVTWITSAKKEETRNARIEKMMQMLCDKKKNPFEK